MMTLLEKINYNVKLIDDVTTSIGMDGEVDLATSSMLNAIHAETQILLVEYIMLIEAENNELKEAIKRLSNKN